MTEVQLAEARRLVPRICRRFKFDRQQAEDVAQDAYVKLLAGASFNPDRGNWASFVCVVTQRAAIDHVRRNRHRGYIEFVDDETCDAGLGTLDKMLLVERVERVRRQVNPRYWGIMCLTAIGYKDEEIAREVGCRTQQVPVLRHRARRAVLRERN